MSESNAGRSPGLPDREAPSPPHRSFNEWLARVAEATGSVLSIARSLTIGALIIAAVVVAWDGRGAIEALLRDAQKLSGFGVSIERAPLTALPIANPARPGGYSLEPGQLESVQARANWVRPVLSGAVILWVDDNPAGNNNLIQFFQWAGISIRFARSNDEALHEMREARAQPFDLVISDIGRDTSGEGWGDEPLRACPLRFLSLPPTVPRDTDLDALNAEANRRPAPGSWLPERMRRELGARSPPLIHFTGHGSALVSACAELTTGDAFHLIHGVFSVLERQRAAEFNRFRPPWAAGPATLR